jgi:hypothetical protein
VGGPDGENERVLRYIGSLTNFAEGAMVLLLFQNMADVAASNNSICESGLFEMGA